MAARRFVFHVQGSAEDPYEVAFVIDDTNATVTCTCPAGQNGQHCKHRIGIIVGAIDNVAEVSGADAEQLRELSALLPNTDVWPTVQRRTRVLFMTVPFHQPHQIACDRQTAPVRVAPNGLPVRVRR